MREQTAVWARLGAGLGALAVGAVAVALVVGLAHRTPGPVQAATPALPSSGAGGSQTTTETSFPVPPANAVVWAREDGPYALALAAVPSTGRLQTSVVDGQGKGVRGLRVTYSVHTKDKVIRATPAKECGAGCYAAALPLDHPTRIDVDVAGKNATTVWRIATPTQWPPQDAGTLVARAGQAWRNLDSLVFHDTLASDPTHSVSTVWRVAAPDKLAYDVEGGPSAVLIGSSRWDKLPGKGWQRSTALPVHQPVPFWAAATDAHVIGSDTLDGVPVWRITFFDPKETAWFEILVEKSTMHTLDLRMTTTAHFMHEQYTDFNQPVRIVPPACSGC